MDKVAERQRVVCLANLPKVGNPLDDAEMLNLVAVCVNFDGHAHPHVLGALEDDAVFVAQQVTFFERLEPKVVERKVAGVVNHLLDFSGERNDGDLCEFLGKTKAKHALGEGRGRVFLVVVDRDAGGEEAVVGVTAPDHHRAGLGGKGIELLRGNTVLDLTTDLLRDDGRIYVLQTLGEFFDAREDLVERDLFAFSVALCYEHYVSSRAMCKWRHRPRFLLLQMMTFSTHRLSHLKHFVPPLLETFVKIHDPYLQPHLRP